MNSFDLLQRCIVSTIYAVATHFISSILIATAFMINMPQKRAQIMAIRTPQQGLEPWTVIPILLLFLVLALGMAGYLPGTRARR